MFHIALPQKACYEPSRDRTSYYGSNRLNPLQPCSTRSKPSKSSSSASSASMCSECSRTSRPSSHASRTNIRRYGGTLVIYRSSKASVRLISLFELMEFNELINVVDCCLPLPKGPGVLLLQVAKDENSY